MDIPAWVSENYSSQPKRNPQGHTYWVPETWVIRLHPETKCYPEIKSREPQSRMYQTAVRTEYVVWFSTLGFFFYPDTKVLGNFQSSRAVQIM
jgi:hypothetical protein